MLQSSPHCTAHTSTAPRTPCIACRMMRYTIMRCERLSYATASCQRQCLGLSLPAACAQAWSNTEPAMQLFISGAVAMPVLQHLFQYTQQFWRALWGTCEHKTAYCIKACPAWMRHGILPTDQLWMPAVTMPLQRSLRRLTTQRAFTKSWCDWGAEAVAQVLAHSLHKEGACVCL